jgi:putative transposase of IS4/5 family DUF4096
VRRLLVLLTEPEEGRRAGLRWVSWRRSHQASARRGHIARRAARQPRLVPAAPPLPTVLAGTAALTDRLWQQIAPLLPPQKPPRGRPALDHRRLLEGLLWVMRTGAPWREMPTVYGSWHTVYSRYQHWCRNGLWDRLCAILHPTAPYQPPPAPG